MKLKIASFQTIIVIGLFILTASCTSQLSEFTPRSLPGDSMPGKSSGSFITANTFAELSKKSTLIVIGRVAGIEDVVNMARDANDPTKPDRQVYVVGQIYKVQVKQFLKGTANEAIFIVQREGILGSSVPKTESEIKNSKDNENYIPLSPDKEYLMFLEPMLGIPEGGYYVGVAQPWRFLISDNNIVNPESPWHEALSYFPPQTLDSVTQQLEHPELFLAIPYPGPTPTGSPYP